MFCRLTETRQDVVDSETRLRYSKHVLETKTSPEDYSTERRHYPIVFHTRKAILKNP